MKLLVLKLSGEAGHFVIHALGFDGQSIRERLRDNNG